MNKQQTISPMQLGVIFFTYMTGSSIINMPGPLIGRANNGAWLSLLLSGGLGFCMLACMLFLHRRYPSLTYVEYSRKLIGTGLTILFSIVTLSFLIQMLTAIVMDVGLFMVSSMMRETPVYVFTFLIFFISALTARDGLEVMARMFTLISLITAFFISMILLLALTEYKPAFLLPILPDGIKPVLHGAVFTFGFPYSEVFLISMLLPFVNKRSSKQLSRTLIMALATNIIILCISNVCTIMALGPFAAKSQYTLFRVARLVEFQEIIQRIESIIGMSLILGSYMKTTVTLYVTSLYISQLFRLKDHRTIIMPVAMLGLMITLVGYDGEAEWGEIVATYHPLWATLAFALPLLILTAVALFKKDRQKSEKQT